MTRRRRAVAGAPDARARVFPESPVAAGRHDADGATRATSPARDSRHGPLARGRHLPWTRTDRAALSPRALSNRPTRGFPCVLIRRRPARHARPIRGGACCRPGHDPGRLRPGSPKLNGMDLSGMPTGDFQLRDTERRLADYRGQAVLLSSASPNARTSFPRSRAPPRSSAGRRRRQLRVLFITVDPGVAPPAKRRGMRAGSAHRDLTQPHRIRNTPCKRSNSSSPWPRSPCARWRCRRRSLPGAGSQPENRRPVGPRHRAASTPPASSCA